MQLAVDSSSLLHVFLFCQVVPHFIAQFAHSADSTQEEKFNGMRFPDDHPDEELYRWNKDHKTGADKKYFPMEYGTVFFAGE